MLPADWVVPSNREAVDADSAWNQRLREEVPALFQAAAEAAKLLPGPPAAAAAVWMACLPLDGEVQVR